jgi:signal transduction histidine kinase/streptogramin lyase
VNAFVKNKLLQILLVIAPVISVAQPSYLQFDRLTVENGLSSNFVHCIFQDKYGWIWFGTSQGLCRFDGVSFKQYKNIPNDSTSLAGDLVRFIFEDHSGNMWVGTENGGLNSYNRDLDNFKFIPDYDDDKRKLTYHANSIAEGPDGDLWLATNSGLKVLNKKALLFTTYKKIIANRNSLCNNLIRKIVFDNRNQLWIGTADGLDCFNAQTKEFKHIFPSLGEGGDNEIATLFKDNEGKILVGTYLKGAFVVDPQSFVSKRLSLGTVDGLSNAVRAIEYDKKGNYWLGTRNGIYIYSKYTGQVTHFAHDERYLSSLSHNSILSIFADKMGDVWIGTREGVSVVNYQKQKFQYIKTFPNDNLFLNNGDVFCFWAKSNNELWIGTDNGGINILDRTDKTFSYIKGSSEKTGNLSGNCIKSIIPDKTGTLWIATYLQGINVYNPQTNRFVNIRHKPGDTSSLVDNRVWTMICDSRNQIWVGTELGVDLVDVNTGKISHLQYLFSSKQVDWIAEDSDKEIWIANNLGIIIYNPQSKTQRRFAINGRTRAFCEDRHKRYWVGSQGKGLLLIDKNKGIVAQVDELNGLPNNSVYSIAVDNFGKLWVGTANGLCKFDSETRKCVSFFKDDGPRINQYNYGAAYKLPTGEMVFGGYGGMVIFNPSEIKVNDFLPPVRFTDLKIYNQSANVGTPNSPLIRNIETARQIELPYKKNYITLCYAALNYNSSKKNQYAYKLEGFDEEWHYVGNKTEASYTNLHPGYYTFRVIGSNNDGRWNKEGAFVVIHIIPPFYKTWLFRILILFLVTGAIVGTIWYRDKLIRLQKKELERKVNLRTVELQNTTQQLRDSQFEILCQKEEISGQNESLILLSEKIQEQNKELEQQATLLEEKVKERTQELEIAKQQAEEADKVKTAFLANVSHEIRTPMNSIVGFSSLLTQDNLSLDEKKEFAVNINKQCNTLLRLINDILDISMIEAGHFAANVSLFNINTLLTELHRTCESEKIWMEKQNLRIVLSLPPVQLFLSSDAVRIEQILRNLINNAIKYTDHGQIEMGYYREDSKVVFFVKDTGIGISQENIDKVFGRFVKFQDDPQRLYRGVGLGLSICKKIVEYLGGDIWVESQINKGSSFYFSIPLDNDSIRNKENS